MGKEPAERKGLLAEAVVDIILFVVLNSKAKVDRFLSSQSAKIEMKMDKDGESLRLSAVSSY